MKLRSGTNTPEINERIKAVMDRLLTAHVALSPAFKHNRWWIICHECGARWAVVHRAPPGSAEGLDLELVTDGDGYCEEGATNYFDSEGNVTKRM